MKEKTEEKPWFEASVIRIAAFIGAFLGIGAAFVSTVNWLSNYYPQRTKFGLSMMNAVIVLIFCLSLRKKKYLYFKKDNNGNNTKSIRDFWNSLGLLSYFADEDSKVEVKGEEKEPIKFARDNEKRVNKLIDQYTSHIFWFALLLFVLYCLFAIDTEKILNVYLFENKYEVFHPIFKIAEDILNFTNSIFIFLGFMVLYDKTLDEGNNELRYKDPVWIFSGIIISIYFVTAIPFITYSLKDKSETSPKTLLFTLNQIIDKQDYLSKLDQKIKLIKENPNGDVRELEKLSARKNTLETIKEIINKTADDEKSRSKTIETIETLVVNFPANDEIDSAITAVYNKIKVYKDNLPKPLASNIMQLIIGSLNGLTMALLFGRYVSIDHALQNIDKKIDEDKEKKPEIEEAKDKKEYSEYIKWGIIIILPVYALAQPLFGSFEIDAFGSPMNFQNIVFFICFVGKTFFLYITWKFIDKRWMHYWFHSALVNHSVPKDFFDCFETQTQKSTNETDNRKDNEAKK